MKLLRLDLCRVACLTFIRSFLFTRRLSPERSTLSVRYVHPRVTLSILCQKGSLITLSERGSAETKRKRDKLVSFRNV